MGFPAKAWNWRDRVADPSMTAKLVLDWVRLLRDWPRFLIARLAALDFVEVHLRNGLRFLVRPRTMDLDILCEVILDDIYGRPEWRLPSSPTIVDIGAHIGAFSVMAASRWPSSSITSYEPHPDNFRLFTRNLRNNECQNVTPVQLAVAAESGVGRLSSFLGMNTGAPSLKKDSGDSAEVSTISLEAILKQVHGPVDLLKVDCEGSEYEILESLSPQSRNRIMRVAVELHAILGISAIEGVERIRRLFANDGFVVSDLHKTRPNSQLLYAWQNSGAC